jgi:cytochrome c biogenesis protein CcdA/arsenate reductase-like glutaredoxin family protein
MPKPGRGIMAVLFAIMLVSMAFPVMAENPAQQGAGNLTIQPTLPVPLEQDGKPVIYFFYNTNCGECQKTLPFIQEEVARHPEVTFSLHDIRRDEQAMALFDEFRKAHGKEYLSVPAVFTGAYVFSGYDEITTNLDDAIRLTVTRAGPLPTLSVPLEQDGKPVVYFFYNTNCGECQKTLPFIQQAIAHHPEAIFSLYDVRQDPKALALFQEFKQAYGKEFLSYPVAFVGGQVLSGYDNITGNLDDAIHLAVTGAATTPVPGGSGALHEELTLPMVITAALVDGINPCAFAVLIFLLVSLMTLDSRRRVLLVGSTFIVAVFVFYFLSGLGIFAVVQVSGTSRLISLVAAVIALAAGVISIADGLRKKNTVLSIPESRKGMIERWVHKGSVPAAAVLGVLVGMFELPCTGGIYLAILSLLSNRMTMVQGIPYLLLYNIIFVLPLVLIMGIIAYGIPAEKFEQWRLEQRATVRIAMGAVMIILGIMLLWEIL